MLCVIYYCADPLVIISPSSAVGRALMELHHYHYRNQTEAEILAENPQLLPGGTWRPTECTARHRVAVVIPYRDRQEHLVVLLSHLIPILTRQQLDYHILVVEQVGKTGIVSIYSAVSLKPGQFSHKYS